MKANLVNTSDDLGCYLVLPIWVAQQGALHEGVESSAAITSLAHFSGFKTRLTPVFVKYVV